MSDERAMTRDNYMDSASGLRRVLLIHAAATSTRATVKMLNTYYELCASIDKEYPIQDIESAKQLEKSLAGILIDGVNFNQWPWTEK